jgi:K(+)-stimulated pyrophosphate-energized sodium pump
MIFSLILLIKQNLQVEPTQILSILNPYSILGFICGGAVIYWFTGASTQAVTTGAYRTVEYIKRNIQLDEHASKSASLEKSKEVVKICTQYAQRGMFNIFIAIFSFALAFAFFSAPGKTPEPVSFFISFLISIAVFGLFQAIFMANAGGAWDNAKKVVEVDMKEKGTDLHAATIVGDTVGDPFKDTSSVAMNPIIKFTTLFGLLAMEISISEGFRTTAPYVGIVLFIIALLFVWRTFYAMRITKSQK